MMMIFARHYILIVIAVIAIFVQNTNVRETHYFRLFRPTCVRKCLYTELTTRVGIAIVKRVKGDERKMINVNYAAKLL